MSEQEDNTLNFPFSLFSLDNFDSDNRFCVNEEYYNSCLLKINDIETSNSDLDNNENEQIDFESENENENNSDNEQYNNNDKDEIIEIIEQVELTACVIIDYINGNIQCCGRNNGKMRQLHNLFGVCDSHFQFDNKYLHKSQNKQLKDFTQGIIQWRRCISCNKFITFFSRGIGCTLHSWNLNKQNIQVPCIGQYACDALRSYPPLCKRAFDNINQQRNICCMCYENLGGHIYHRPGREKSATTCITEKLHVNDTTKGLKYLGKWLINIAQIDDDNIKKKILTKTFETLLPFCKITSTNTTSTSIHEKNSFIEPPSLFIMKILFTSTFKNEEKRINDFEKFGHEFGQKLWNSRSDINLKKHILESKRLIKGNNIWKLAVIDNIDFKEKSFKFGNIYDITHNSSHATLRLAFQAHLPFEIETGPEPVIELTAETPLFGMNKCTDETLMLFQQTIEELLDFKKINNELIFKKDFDAETIKHIILSKLNPGCLGPSPDVIILEPGANPNSDEEILHVAEMYKEDFTLENHSFLDIVADQAIHSRLIKCQEKWPKIRPLLGQWHTSKDFCSVLLVLFSSYGLLSLASRLGVRFLDKFEMAVDYRSTARVLDLIWAAVEKRTRIANQPLINSTESVQKEVAENSNKRQLDLDELSTHNIIEPQSKKRKTGTKRQTTKDETEILSALKVYKDKLLDNAIAAVREQLLEIWTVKKVREWWNNHKNK
ncbi:hypothetical protein Glove_309g4 [Diversispora epigaea]|uniref:Uncharacterized protein n=1 Tax=Diversispora epigaea TaxID=1348612 RepID=A0A397HSB6_9GLOM|nr:hypothetical protein Glove_309g4 [Diversispora epigaea]